MRKALPLPRRIRAGIGPRQRLERDREIGGADPPAGAADRQPFERVLELADVAGPRVRGEPREHLLVERRRRQREPARDPREGGARQRRHVLGPRAQRRQLDPRHREPEVEVGAEAPGAHLPRQVARGGRHHARPHRDRRAPTHPLEAAVLEHVQQPGLEWSLELAHLVEEERPLGRALEATHPTRERAGERATLVPEQLALEQRVGQRRAVGVDERAAPARQRVQRPRCHALPHPGLAGHQHGGVERRELRELGADRVQAGAGAGETTQRVFTEVGHG